MSTLPSDLRNRAADWGATWVAVGVMMQNARSVIRSSVPVIVGILAATPTHAAAAPSSMARPPMLGAREPYVVDIAAAPCRIWSCAARAIDFNSRSLRHLFTVVG